MSQKFPKAGALCRSPLRLDFMFFSDPVSSKILTCEISDFTPCGHAQSNNHVTHYGKQTWLVAVIGLCWVRVASSTWSISRLWNTTNRRFQLL